MRSETAEERRTAVNVPSAALVSVGEDIVCMTETELPRKWSTHRAIRPSHLFAHKLCVTSLLQMLCPKRVTLYAVFALVVTDSKFCFSRRVKLNIIL